MVSTTDILDQLDDITPTTDAASVTDQVSDILDASEPANAGGIFTSTHLLSVSVVLLLSVFLLIFTMISSAKRFGMDGADGPWLQCLGLPSLQEVADRWYLSYLPLRLCECLPVSVFGKSKVMASESPIHAIMWVLIFSWLAASAVYLIILAAATNLELFDDDAISRGVVFMIVAVLLSAAWPYVFRLGEMCSKGVKTDAVQSNTYMVAMLLRIFAWIFSVMGIGEFKPMLYPGPAMILTVGIGFGLFSGWLLVCSLLSAGIYAQSLSTPEGNMPSEGDTLPTDSLTEKVSHIHLDETQWHRLRISRCVSFFIRIIASLPLMAAIIAFITALSLTDPLQAAPLLVSLSIFTRWLNKEPNAIAAFVAFLATLISALQVADERSKMQR